MKLIILLLFSIQSFGQLIATAPLRNTIGVVYYVAQGGSGDGLSPAAPMDDSDLLVTSLGQNDIVFFNRGDEFLIGDYDVSSPVVVSTYGSGADPILTSTSDISGLTWTPLGGDIYSAPMASEPKWIWIAGLCAKNAETARVTVSARGSTSLITVPNGTLDVYTSIVGAYIVVKEKNFQQSYRRTITNFDKPTDVITVDAPIDITSNIDLVVYNDQEFLTGNNEWVWDSGTLYVRAAASPSTLDIKSSAFEYGIKTSESISIDNIEFKEYYITPIWSTASTTMSVTNCSFHDIRDAAILVQHKVEAPVITNNSFLRIGNNGITMRPADDAVVTDNTFTDIGMQSNYGWQIWVDDATYTMSVGCAMAYVVDQSANTVDGTNLIFDNNTISNTAYCGLLMGLGTDSFIRENIVDDFMNRFDDGGGLYVFHFRATNIPNANTEISNNFVSNNNVKAAGIGIYCDNRTFAAYVHHNSVQNITGGGFGILFNFDTSDHTCEYNNVTNCTYGVVFRQNNPIGFLYNSNENNQLNFNNVAGRLGNQVPLYFKLNYSNPTWNPFDGGGANNNRYVKSLRTFNVAESDNQGGLLTLAALQTAYGQDAASTFQFEIPELITNQTAATSNEDGNSDYMDLDGNTLTTYTIDPYYSRLIVEKDYSNVYVEASSQYHNIGTTADIQFTDASTFSIGFWIKIAANPASIQRILTNQNSGTSRGISVDVLTSGVLEVRFTNTTATNRMIWRTTTDVADNTWHHILIAAPATKTNTKIYLDGISNETLNANNLSATILSTDTWRVGAGPAPSIYWAGLIDDLAIWGTSMIGNQISIANGGVVMDYRDTFPPLHYWKMGVTSDLVDLGSSATDLTLSPVNSPASSTDVP